ncbi:hypothetical protein Hdeb2414_s0011g00363391 [Helianthus debilis subsp. tardiflorus]
MLLNFLKKRFWFSNLYSLPQFPILASLKSVIRFQNSNGFQILVSNSPFIQMTKTLIRFQNMDNVLSLSWFSFSLSNGFWLSVLLVSRVSESTFQQSWLGFRPNSAHTGKSGAKDFMFGCLSFVFISGMRPSPCSFTHFGSVLPPETFPLTGNFSSPPYDILNTISNNCRLGDECRSYA